jgi:hypothetical protein
MTVERIRTEGEVEYRFTHPDDFRAHVRDRKGRCPVPKLVTAKEAVARFVSDGDYIVYDFSSLTRGPQSLIREVIRQRKKELWIGAESTSDFSVMVIISARLSAMGASRRTNGRTADLPSASSRARAECRSFRPATCLAPTT